MVTLHRDSALFFVKGRSLAIQFNVTLSQVVFLIIDALGTCIVSVFRTGELKSSIKEPARPNFGVGECTPEHVLLE